MTALSQAIQLAIMCAAGCAAGAVSVIFRAARRLMRAGWVLSAVSDIIMGALWGAIFCFALYFASRGEMRIYHLLAFGAGGILLCAAMPSVKILRRFLFR